MRGTFAAAAWLLSVQQQASALRPLRQEPYMRKWYQQSRAARVLRKGPLELFAIERGDVKEISLLVASCFPSVIVEEDPLLQAAASVSRAWDALEFSVGLVSRCGSRLEEPRVDDRDLREALVLTLARGDELVASLELRIRDADGSAPPAVTMFEANKRPMPYVANVCVAADAREGGLAWALLDAAEHISCRVWGYDALFLHVGTGNDAALRLYSRNGYTELNDFRTRNLSFHGKRLGRRSPASIAEEALEGESAKAKDQRRRRALLLSNNGKRPLAPAVALTSTSRKRAFPFIGRILSE